MKEFPEFQKRVRAFLDGSLTLEDEVEFKRLLCSDCDFFKPGEDENLCCGCFLILKRLITRGYITLKEISDALK